MSVVAVLLVVAPVSLEAMAIRPGECGNDSWAARRSAELPRELMRACEAAL